MHNRCWKVRPIAEKNLHITSISMIFRLKKLDQEGPLCMLYEVNSMANDPFGQFEVHQRDVRHFESLLPPSLQLDIVNCRCTLILIKWI